jgi:hypothetical protein
MRINLYNTKQTNLIINLKNKQMKNLIVLILKIANLVGAKFIAINGYESKETGEVANYVILTNIKVNNAKQKDLETLQNCNSETLKVIKRNSAKDIALEIYNLAHSEMLESSVKNLNSDFSQRSAQSQAQTVAYEHITDAIKVCKSTDEVHIFGMIDQKKVIVEGTYKTVNSSDKTIAKKQITKQLNLRAGKFRTFVLTGANEVTMNGETLTINLR